MNDIEFAHRVSLHIGDLYAEAKRAQHHFPAHSLTQMRGIVSLCCDILGGDDPAPGLRGPDEKIRALVAGRRINPDTRSLLNDLRRWGNAAAHPEESLVDQGKLAGLASRALQSALSLLETTFRHKHRGAAVPAYEVVEEDPDRLDELCYRALVDNSAIDQYRAALALADRLSQERAPPLEPGVSAREHYRWRDAASATSGRIHDLLRYASDGGYPPARYEYGLALIAGRNGPDRISLGAHLIGLAANDGDVDALAWCGNAALFGLHEQPVDHDRAFELLTRAAAEDHPDALSLLARMHREGLGREANAELAFGLTLRAAEAGYPLAQYEAAIALRRGAGTDHDEQVATGWLQLAADAGQPDAQLALARHVRRTGGADGEQAAVQLLERAAQRLNEARFELAGLYMATRDVARWISAIDMLQSTYETAEGEQAADLAQRCREVAPAWIGKIEALFESPLTAPRSNEVIQGFIYTRSLFDDARLPYPRRQDARAAFFENLKDVRNDGVSEPASIQRLLRKYAAPATTRSRVQRVPALAPVVQRSGVDKVGRNAPCVCGSGSKSKSCKSCRG